VVGSRLRCASVASGANSVPLSSPRSFGAPLLLLGQRHAHEPPSRVRRVIVSAGLALIPDGGRAPRVACRCPTRDCVVGWLLITQAPRGLGFDASWTERGHILRVR